MPDPSIFVLFPQSNRATGNCHLISSDFVMIHLDSIDFDFDESKCFASVILLP